jgi:hypothetical protein
LYGLDMRVPNNVLLDSRFFLSAGPAESRTILVSIWLAPSSQRQEWSFLF